MARKIQQASCCSTSKDGPFPCFELAAIADLVQDFQSHHVNHRACFGQCLTCGDPGHASSSHISHASCAIPVRHGLVESENILTGVREALATGRITPNMFGRIGYLLNDEFRLMLALRTRLEALSLGNDLE